MYMKNMMEEIRSVLQQSKDWIKMEVEYTKLTVAEKLTLLMGTLILGFVCLLLGFVVLILLAFSLAEVFKMMMCPSLAYLSTAGAICVLLVLLYLFRKPVLLNPIARMLTRIFFDNK